MFKIICLNTKDNPNITHMEILIANNKPVFVNPMKKNFDLSKYLLPVKSYNWFKNFSGINLKNLLDYYNYNTENITVFRHIVNFNYGVSPILRKLMLKSNWFGYILYAENIDVLERVWSECQQFEKEFDTLEYHKEFYELTKKRFLRDGTNVHKYLQNIK